MSNDYLKGNLLRHTRAEGYYRRDASLGKVEGAWKTFVQGNKDRDSRIMELAQVQRSEMDNFNTPDLDQGSDSILRPGETLDDFDVTFRRPNAQGGMIGKPGGLVEEGVVMYGVSNTPGGKYRANGSRRGVKFSEWSDKGVIFDTKKEAEAMLKKFNEANPTFAEANERSLLQKENYKFKDKDLKVLDEYAQYKHGMDYNELYKKDKVLGKAVRRIAKQNDYKFTTENIRNALTEEQQAKIVKAFPETKFDFETYKKYGIPRDMEDGKRSKVYQNVADFVLKRDFQEAGSKTRMLDEKQIKIIKDNFDLPDGTKDWNFKKYTFGVSSTENPLVTRRMEKKITAKTPFALASDFSSPKGWMMHAMYRAYKNQIKNNGKSDYKPIRNKDKTQIIGFVDNTVSGGGNKFYGLDKNTPKGSVPWSAHKDYNNISKMVDITKRLKEDPAEFIQKLITEKGVTGKVRLNDILSFDRYYDKLSEVKPAKLIEAQIVKHHTGGVGANKLKQAAATKDIQLLTGAINNKVRTYEGILKGTTKNAARSLTNEENKILKNLNAQVVGPDGTIYGGGSLDAEKQFKIIEQQAAEAVKSEKFNEANYKKYLAAIGCPNGQLKAKVGGNCVTQGVEKVNNGMKGVTSPATWKNFGKLAKFGRNVMKFGVIPEAIFVGAETAIRIGMGDNISEALKKSVSYITDTVAGTNYYDEATASKLLRDVGFDKAINITRFNDYNEALAKKESLKNNLNTNLMFNDESLTGKTDAELTSEANKFINNADKDIQKKFLDEVDFTSFSNDVDYAKDVAGVRSPLRQFIGNARNKTELMRVEDDFSGMQSDMIAPEITQKDLNKKMLPQYPVKANMGPLLTASQDQLKTYGEDSRLESGKLEGYVKNLNKERKLSLQELASKYGNEQIFGTQGTFFGEKIKQKPMYDYADGGLAGLMKKYYD